jgi:hypothetical protein
MNPVRGLWTWWKRIGVTICLIGLAGLFWSSSIWYDYQRTLPRHPESAVGRIYPLNVHGIVVYQTREERNWLDEIQYSSIAVFAVGALMGLIYQKRFGRPPTPPKFGPTPPRAWWGSWR